MTRTPVVTEPGFDVIGDVHGCFDELVGLLGELGYDDESGAFGHATRQAVFVGDLIDRGPRQVDVLRVVRAMVDAGTALAVMGNHEFNAIAYSTAHPRAAGEYLRPHSAKNTAQHAEFLCQVGFGSAAHEDAVEWFSTLPLWLDLGGLRVVHACWDPAAIAGLGSPMVDDLLMIAASTKGRDEYRWVETLCKGPEVPLPAGYTMRDKDGHDRRSARLRWWEAGANTYAAALDVPPTASTSLPDEPIEVPPPASYGGDVPVVFGHYWRRWPDIVMTEVAACVDYSAVLGGPLVAYRWSGEPKLRRDHLVPSQWSAPEPDRPRQE